MPAQALTLRLEKGSPLTPTEMDNNLKVLRNFVNALEQLQRVSLNSDGTLKAGAVNTANQITDGLITLAKLAADARIPAGTIADFGGTVVPTGWLECAGAAISRPIASGGTVDTYEDLWDAIGTTWGIGDGATTFNVPNLARRTLVGRGGAGTGTLGNAVGNTGGAETVTLDATTIPATLSLGTVCNDLDNGAGVGGTQRILADEEYTDGQYTATQNFTNSGGGQAHSNVQPSAIVMKIIKI